MGKKVKRKDRSVHKERRVSYSSLPTIPGHSPTDEIGGGGISIVNERISCTHLDKGVDVVKISSKIGSLESVRCEDCRESAVARRANKGSKNGKKKGMGSSDTKSASKSIWVCLECGHFSCGGVGLPTIPQSHAVRHTRQTRHPCVIQFDNPNLCWCFRCNSLIPVEKSEENGEQKDILWEAMRLIKGQSPEVALMEVEDVFFGGGHVRSETNSANSESRGLNGRLGFVVRGLYNLGNTCFFNSVTQSLLAVDRLRDYFIKLDSSVGPLTMALKKLFFETSREAGSRNVINPKSFFGCICAKAPQFRGYQQHDSHELLRYLLDGLYTEELNVRKFVFSSGEDETKSKSSPTFVEATFGGQLSSTVCCVECGHSSIVYEPFLDLSLSVPTKKSSSKNSLPVSRGRKQKLPLKKGGRACVKGKTDAAPILAQCATVPSESGVSSCQVSYSVPVAENMVASLDESTWLDSNGPGTTYHESDPISQHHNISFIQDSVNKKIFQNVAEQTVASVDNFMWLDYIESGTASDDQNLVSQNNDIPLIHDSGNKQVLSNDDMLQNSSSEPCSQVCSPNREPDLEMDSYRGNCCEDELPLQVQGSEVILLPYKEEISTMEGMVRGEGEASSSILGCEEGLLDFDGFGNLFNEPEMISRPNAKSWSGDKNFQVNEVAETGYLATNSNESDPDEVDNEDSPVSVESCLAYFTKPELLCNEYGWHCESCSKILRIQRMESRTNWPKTTSKTQINGGVVRSQNTLVGLDDDFPYPTDSRNLNNGKAESFTVFTATAESLISDSGRLDDPNRNCSKHENTHTIKERDLKLNPISNCRACYPNISQRELNLGELNNTLQDPSPSSGHYKTCSQASFGDQASDSCSVNERNNIGCNFDQVQERDSQLLARVCESDDSEGEEIDSNSVKVKRDAIKRMLINRAPPVLTIHLKRFSQDARGRLSKLSGHVNFRDTIDLRPYMEHRCTEGDTYDYHLVGVVEHSGTMRGGHYVAYVRGEGSGGYTWYHTSDGYVRAASVEEVLRCEAYILFYEKF